MRWLVGMLAVGLVGCAGPRTTVLLLPDADQHVGAVTLSTAKGSRALDRAFHAIDDREAPPAEVSPERVQSRHAELLRAEPPAPRSFVLHFQNDKTVLTDASRSLLPEILAAVRERAPTEVTVFGHADATGTEDYNLKLSAARAQAIADWLRRQDPSIGPIGVQYFGQARPAVPSPPGRAEPANRRAEILVL
jgi:peptidoglycan-associated lipoprotein